MKTYYVVLRDDEMVMATTSCELADGYMESVIEDDMVCLMEDEDINPDELSYKQLGEVAFMAGYYGSSMELETVEIPDEYDDDDTVTLSNGAEVYIKDIFDIAREPYDKENDYLDRYEDENEDENEDCLREMDFDY